jgi:predicted O-linked N-acetylglucosamine transferase (SPINDLY family)
VLHYWSFGDEAVRRRFTEAFAGIGVDPGRLDLRGWSQDAHWLEAYRQVDLALDPFPFSGCTTTCEALWMGVPVITCPGETYYRRQSVSPLSAIGLTETIAGSLDEYIEIAVALASDLPRLAMLREGLRQRMAASPLCDGKRFATHLMSMLQDL